MSSDGTFMDESYNQNSRYQLSIIQTSKPFIEKGIDALEIHSSLSPLIIADFGSAHGKNSIYTMKQIIEYLRTMKNYSGSFLIVHNDLAANNWTALFEHLNKDNSYHGVASGRSFYEQCLPNNSLSIGYSSTSAHWLSEKPCNISDHCFMPHSLNAKEKQLFKEQSYLDYSRFLKHRSNELHTGGILILSIICEKDEVRTSFNLLYKCVQMIPLTQDELLEFTFPVHYRTYEECTDGELFNRFSLELITSELVKVESPFYTQWRKKEITLEEFARLNTGFIRAISEPLLKQTLIAKGRTEENIVEILNRFWPLYEQKVREQPDFNDSYGNFAFIVLKKK